ncbi:reprolysin-like metallopeptidase [Pseudoalteromonas sp. NBT06-2]|uniref:reprolysin-like metallopeptidase n=1 Tax=Pseudoalteromonas sp. NBT06-2 TaxID=2025950 RepID=UPI0014830ADE|nr:zinc-dependent metalloprotease family protein [Pseudoalteromonas sp. NBT06-2]
MRNIYLLFVLLSAFISVNLEAINKKTFKNRHWIKIFDNPPEEHSNLNSKASKSAIYNLDLSSFSNHLFSDKEIIVELPLPNGDFAIFNFQPSSIMAPGLSLKYPSIRTFSGFEVGNSKHKGRFDISTNGFHGVFIYKGDKVFIEPISRNNNKTYHSYFRADAQTVSDKSIGKRFEPIKDKFRLENLKHAYSLKRTNKIEQTKDYRIAIATTGEYSEFHGGTKESTLAALVTLLNRVNEIYQNELAIKLVLVNNNDTIVYTDKDTDPFKNTDEDIDVISDIINTSIGVDNYDIGHIIGTGGGGLAGFAVVCSEFKAEGVTGSASPTGDAFHVDYVAHEIGHQFGADHTFNGSLGACDGNRETLSAYEPGSASTIMGYAGICDDQNLQNNSDPYFHIRSIDQIRQFSSQGATCGTSKTQNNHTPIIDALAEFTIPAKTPFTLTGQATDAENDSLSYSWEQYDLGVQSSSKQDDQIDDGTRPLFRSFSPKETGDRTFPKIESIIANNIVFGETLPTTTRTLNFRLAVRDGQGNIADQSVKLNVIQSDNGFNINEPSASTRWNDTVNLVTWDTSNTQQAPVSCSYVDILLSTDSGINFNHTLVLNTLNDGSQEVEILDINTNKARIKVKCKNNIFFTINSSDFEINSGSAIGSKPIFSGQKDLEIDEDISLDIVLSDLIFEGNQQVDSLSLAGGDNYTFSGLKVKPNENFNGILHIIASAKKGDFISELFNIKVIVNSVNDLPSAKADFESVDKGSTGNYIDVLTNDTDIDNDILIIKSFEYIGIGSVELSGNKLIYTPAVDFTGVELIAYSIDDGNQGTSTNTVTITVMDESVEEAKKSSGGSLSYFLSLIALFIARKKRVKK